MTKRRRAHGAVVSVVLGSALLGGCSVDGTLVSGAAVSGTAITVTVSHNGCTLSAASATAGEVLFTVVNTGEEVAAFTVRGADAGSLGGVGNIPSGIARDAVLVLDAGSYTAECTPGPAAQGIEARFTVTGATIATPISTAGGSASYLAWLRATTTQLVSATRGLATAFDAGDPAARQRYVEARALWSSLHPATQRFPELLPAIEARESDLVAGERLTGWHAIERELWPSSDYEPLDADGRARLSAALVADVVDLAERIEAPAFAMDAVEIAAGAQGLLDAASRSLIDNDERWSHAERWLVQGDLDGAIAAVEALRPGLSAGAPELLATVDERATSLQAALDAQSAEPRELASRVDALAAALSELHALIALGDARIEP